MKYFKFVIVFILVSVSQSANAETYVVNTPVLNIRTCAGTNCNVIGKLKKGDFVDSIQNHGQWVEIETDKGNGYVIKKALAEDNATRSNSETFMFIVFIISFIIFVYLLPYFVATNNRNRNKIFFINLFLGWIPVVWLILLLAALTGEKEEHTFT